MILLENHGQLKLAMERDYEYGIGTKTRAIRKVPNGKKVEVMFVKGKYAKVRYRGTVGYMKSAYLK